MADLSIRSLWVRLAAPHLYNCEAQELLALIRRGNQQACCALYDRYKRPLARFAYYLSENEKRAQKLVQQAFLDFFVLIKGQASDPKLKPWLYRHVIMAYTADFSTQNPVAWEKRSFRPGQSELEALANRSQKHLLAILSEMQPRSRAQFLLWALADLELEEQAWVFELGPGHWQVEWEQACLEALEWDRIIQQDHSEQGEL